MEKSTNHRTENTELSQNDWNNPDNRKIIHVFFYLLLLFTTAQVIGFYTGLFIKEDAKNNEIIQNLQLVEESETTALAYVFYLFFYVLVGALFMYLMVKFCKIDLFFVFLEFAVISISSSVVFYAFIKPLLVQTEFSMIIAIALGFAFGLLKVAFSVFRNITAVIATAGAGAIFAFSLNFYASLLFLVLLSIYDYIAVFKTKHMVEIAEVLSKKQMSFLISSSQRTTKGEIKLELGTGDILLPIILEITGFWISFAHAAIIFVSSFFSLFVLFVLLAKKKTALPALPIIALCIFVFLGLAKLIGII